MDKNKIIFFIVVIIVISIVVWAVYAINNNNLDKKTAQCIASQSTLYVSKTCSHCAKQKIILEDYIDLFEVIDCTTETEKCVENSITAVPTWIINNKKYPGLKTLKTLKELARC